MEQIIAVQSDQTIRNIRDYQKFNHRLCRKIKQTAKLLKGKTIIHLNSTSQGGGVAELLKSQVLLEKSLGLNSQWFSLNAPKRFFFLTKKIHNLLQGKADSLKIPEKNYYLKTIKRLRKSLEKMIFTHHPDIIIIHDPQPLPLVDFLPKELTAVLRLHIDLSAPNLQTLNFLKPHILKCDQLIVSNPDFQKHFSWFKKNKITIILPAIDPLTEKNKPLDLKTARYLLTQYKIDTTKPIVSQVSRFDPWKDPLGVIEAWQKAKQKIVDLQLILVGFFFAQDDPEAQLIYQKIQQRIKGLKDIFVFADPKKLGLYSNDKFINAVYTASTIIMQKSLREGFGLTITEAMWKGRAVIAGKASGPLRQIKNGRNGLIVSSINQATQAISQLIAKPQLRKKLGLEAQKSVKEKFLMPRYLLDHLSLYLKILH